MLEVFICFHSEYQAPQVLDTAERWRKTKGAYPSIIQVPEQGFELKRRVLADKLAKTDMYMIADVCCVPAMPALISTIEKRFTGLGMAGLTLRGSEHTSIYPTGVRVCKKGIVDKWPQQVTDDYDQEHTEAIRKTGERVEIWPDVIYFHLVDENAN